MSGMIRHSTAKEVFEPRESVLARGFIAKDYSIAMHDHDFYEINIVLCGRGVHIVGDKDIPASAGDVFVIPPSVVHGYRCDGTGFDVYHLIVKEEFISKYSDELSGFSGFRRIFEVEPYLRERSGRAYLHIDREAMDFLSGCIGLLSSLAGDGSCEADTLRSSLALTVIGYISRQVGKGAPSASHDRDVEAMAEVLDFIDGNLSERITVEMLSARANMSRATFMRRFISVCGMPPHAYITERRVAEARRLISHGSTVTDAAAECGFYDASHLLKMMKRDCRL